MPRPVIAAAATMAFMHRAGAGWQHAIEGTEIMWTIRLGLAAFIAAVLAACTTAPQPQADLTPPQLTKRDAKAELESGIRPR